MRIFICSICREETLGWGHNAQPLSAGRCCDLCNVKVVVARIVRERDDGGKDA